MILLWAEVANEQEAVVMVSVDQAMPPGIVDRMLWRDAQDMLERHPGADHDSKCVWCGGQWPCAPRRLAERAEEASRRPWRETLTARHDLNSLRTTRAPGLINGRRSKGGARHSLFE